MPHVQLHWLAIIGNNTCYEFSCGNNSNDHYKTFDFVKDLQTQKFRSKTLGLSQNKNYCPCISTFANTEFPYTDTIHKWEWEVRPRQKTCHSDKKWYYIETLLFVMCSGFYMLWAWHALLCKHNIIHTKQCCWWSLLHMSPWQFVVSIWPRNMCYRSMVNDMFVCTVNECFHPVWQNHFHCCKVHNNGIYERNPTYTMYDFSSHKSNSCK